MTSGAAGVFPITEKAAEGVEHHFSYAQASADLSTRVIISTGRICLLLFMMFTIPL
jgi:hypothetical protein